LMASSLLRCTFPKLQSADVDQFGKRGRVDLGRYSVFNPRWVPVVVYVLRAVPGTRAYLLLTVGTLGTA